MVSLLNIQWIVKTPLLMLGAVLVACTTSLPTVDHSLTEKTLALALTGQPLLGRAVEINELPEQNLFVLTDEMKTFAKEKTRGIKSRGERARALHEGLLLSPVSGGLGISYSAYQTMAPVDVFNQRQANCLSFTLLYVSMARYLGLNAFVNEVDVPPAWDIRNRHTFLFLRHVNSRIKLQRDEIIVDLEMSRYKPSYSQREISDQLAAAQFYNNRGMELSATGDLHAAFLHLRKALELDPKKSYIWNNVASLYRRQNLLEEAEVLYLQGLRWDESDLSIISNLAGVYRQTGDLEKAKIFSSRAESHRFKNPYYLYSEAFNAYDNGDSQQASSLLQRAIKRERKEKRFYELGVKVYESLGEETMADRMRDRMGKL